MKQASDLQEIPPSFFELKRQDYEGQLKLIKRKSASHKKKLLSFDVKSLLNKPIDLKILILLSAHEYLMFSWDIEIENKLKEFGLGQNQIKWFISIDEIKKQFEIIENKGIILDKLGILLGINAHLKTKFTNELMFWADEFIIRDGVRINQITKLFTDLDKRRKSYSGEAPKYYTDRDEMLLNEQINYYISLSEGELSIKDIITFTKGKSEKPILKTMLEMDFQKDEKFSKRKFHGIIYNLFRIFMKDKNAPDYDSMTQIKKGKDNWVAEKAAFINQYIYK